MSDWSRRDREALWHPATHFGDLERLPPLFVSRAEGAHLYTESGEAVFDAIGSWWTSILGHNHPEIVEAVRAQIGTLDHVMFAGFTHQPAIELAEALLEAAPGDYGKVFYSDCGSASIEVALKLSYQTRILTGEPERRRFATLQNSYHGETLGALSVCGPGSYRDPFGPLLLDSVLNLPTPTPANHRHHDLGGQAGATDEATTRALALLREHAQDLTALVVEPIVQCAGKMAMPGSGFFREIVQCAQSLGIHVIADEIAVGFWRTDRFLASQWAGVEPDLVCLSKALSGGVLPLAATLVRRGFDEPFHGHPSRSFLHSHTFTGNPIATAAGLASLRCLRSERWQRRRTEVIAQLDRLANELLVANPHIGALRQAGTIVALDLEGQGPTDGRISLALRAAALRRGVLLRPLHDTIYWMVPLCSTDAELEQLAQVTDACVREVLA